MSNKKICVWKYDDYKDHFKTDCGYHFCYRNGGCIYSNFNYCPFCGSVIEEKK